MDNKIIVPTDSHVLLDVGFIPFTQVSTFTTTHIQYFACNSPLPLIHWTFGQGRMCKSGDEDRLHPIIEVLQTNDGGIQTLLDSDIRASIILETALDNSDIHFNNLELTVLDHYADVSSQLLARGLCDILRIAASSSLPLF